MHVFQAGGSCLSLLTARSAEGFSDLNNIIQESESQYNDREYDWIQSNYGCSQRGEGLDLISAPRFLYLVLALTGLARNFAGWSTLRSGWVLSLLCLSLPLHIYTFRVVFLLVYLLGGGLAGSLRGGMGEKAGRKEGSSAPPVSARFHRLFWSSPAAPDAAA